MSWGAVGAMTLRLSGAGCDGTGVVARVESWGLKPYMTRQRLRRQDISCWRICPLTVFRARLYSVFHFSEKPCIPYFTFLESPGSCLPYSVFHFSETVSQPNSYL